MRPAKVVLTGGAPVRMVMTMTMAMAMVMTMVMAMAMMSVRRKVDNKSDVWIY